jgi:four helix bundle protein
VAKAERFEDLIAWQKARVLTKAVYQASSNGPFAKDFGLTNQIRRAAVSIMSNIAEGFERGNAGDYGRFLAIAKASCGEVRSQLYVAYDVGYLEKSIFEQLYTQTVEVSRIIGGLIAAVTDKRNNLHF